MENFVQPYDMEFMKMAMLKHEETFKEQVYELHRLYQIQKVLMQDMQKNRPNVQNQENWHSNNRTISSEYQTNQNKFEKQQKINKFDLERPADENGDVEVEDEGEIELTLGPTRRKKKTESPPPLTSDSLTSFSSSSIDLSRIKRITRDNSGFLSGRRNNTSSNSSDREEQMRHPWLYQVLSLKMA